MAICLLGQVPAALFLTQPNEIKKFDIFRGNFPNPNPRWLTQPKQQKIDPTNPGQKFLTRTHHYNSKLSAKDIKSKKRMCVKLLIA